MVILCTVCTVYNCFFFQREARCSEHLEWVNCSAWVLSWWREFSGWPLTEFWRRILSGCQVCDWGIQYHLCTGGSSHWVWLPATASFFTFLYFCLSTSKFIYFQHEARCSEHSWTMNEALFYPLPHLYHLSLPLLLLLCPQIPIVLSCGLCPCTIVYY